MSGYLQWDWFKVGLGSSRIWIWICQRYIIISPNSHRCGFDIIVLQYHIWITSSSHSLLQYMSCSPEAEKKHGIMECKKAFLLGRYILRVSSQTTPPPTPEKILRTLVVDVFVVALIVRQHLLRMICCLPAASPDVSRRNKLLPEKKCYFSNTHTIHVWYLYLYMYHKNKPNAGKYTIHGSYGIYLVRIRNDCTELPCFL